MDETSNLKQMSAIPSGRGDKRRKRILQALHDCIIEKGYVKTTLADVARAAGMYPSHLLYYFNGKEAILEYYFQTVAERIINRIIGFRNETPIRQIDLLADLFFAGKGMTKSEIGFMLECFGVAVNDRVLQRAKTEIDKQCKEYLTGLFENIPSGGFKANPKDAAEIAYAMLIGLRTAVYFDDNLTLPEALRLFRTTMLNLSGYTPSD